MVRKLLKLASVMLSAAGAYIIYKLAFAMPETTENVYSRVVYPFLTKIIGNITNLFSFSVGEILLYLFLLYIIFALVFSLAAVFAPAGKKLYLFFRRLITMLVVICVVYFSFVTNWGLNYAREPLANTMGIETSQASVTELKDICIKLTNEANVLRKKVCKDADGVFTLSHAKEYYLSSVKNLYDSYAPDYMNSCVKMNVKGVLMPDLLSKFETTGIFSPFTYEPNINMQMPDLTFPAVTAHEYAHLQGFAREDEANFISWYLCAQSSEADYAYAGNVLALIYATNALAEASAADFDDVYSLLCDGILRDFAAYNDYWHGFESAMADRSGDLYNTYLQKNGISDGKKSYGRMIDLIIALDRNGSLPF